MMDDGNLNNKRQRHPTERGREYQESLSKKRHFSSSNIGPSQSVSTNFPFPKPPSAVQITDPTLEVLSDFGTSEWANLLEMKPSPCCSDDCEAKVRVEALHNQIEMQQQQINMLIENKEQQNHQMLYLKQQLEEELKKQVDFIRVQLQEEQKQQIEKIQQDLQQQIQQQLHEHHQQYNQQSSSPVTIEPRSTQQFFPEQNDQVEVPSNDIQPQMRSSSEKSLRSEPAEDARGFSGKDLLDMQEQQKKDENFPLCSLRISKISKESVKTFVSGIMKLAYSEKYLTTHTMKYSRTKTKTKMDPEQLEIIIDECMQHLSSKFQNLTRTDITHEITQTFNQYDKKKGG